MPKYGIFPGLYFPVFSPNTGKYGPEKTPYLNTFQAVEIRLSLKLLGIIEIAKTENDGAFLEHMLHKK